MEQKGRFADSRFSADQHHRTRHYPPAENPVQLIDSRTDTFFFTVGRQI
jgi:hypothetical protein